MSVTDENIELIIPTDHVFVYEGSKVSTKIYLLAGAPEHTKTALTDFFETVDSDAFRKAVKELLHVVTRDLGRTRWLDQCEFTELIEPFDAKVAFVNPSFRLYNGGKHQPSINFCVLITHVGPYMDIDTSESFDKFNVIEKVRETAEDI